MLKLRLFFLGGIFFSAFLLTALLNATGGALAQSGSFTANAVVETDCRDGTAVFSVRNEGRVWTGLTDLRAIDEKGDHMSLARRRGLEPGRVITIEVADPHGAVSLFLTQGWYVPEWKPRASKPLAQINCG